MSRVAHSTSFRDPVGLLLRMLKSGNRAAYSALFREGLRLAAIPFDAVLSYVEQRRLASPVESRHPLILVVGAPRSGTTLVYQALSHYLDVTSPCNLSALFPKSPLTASKLHSQLPSFRRPDFRNFYGQTTHLSGPNDAFHIWDRWLGENRYQPAENISSESAAEMRQFFATWTNTFDKPFLNKNNRNASCILLLAEQLPDARFVVVRRNPLFVAQSLIKARQQVQGDKSVGWGLQSTVTESAIDPLAYVDDVCHQIASIDHDMDEQLAGVDAARFVHITYEGFCDDPQSSIRRIAQTFDGLELNSRALLDDLEPFETSQQMTLLPAEQNRIRQRLSRATGPDTVNI